MPGQSGRGGLFLPGGGRRQRRGLTVFFFFGQTQRLEARRLGVVGGGLGGHLLLHLAGALLPGREMTVRVAP